MAAFNNLGLSINIYHFNKTFHYHGNDMELDSESLPSICERISYIGYGILLLIEGSVYLSCVISVSPVFNHT